VLVTFYMRDIIPLRTVALASNFAFIAYGVALHLTPIWMLHLLLLPMNGCRLVQALRSGRDNALSCKGIKNKDLKVQR
jgi:CRP/FNR family cyclic AMP-dependent transcriptional regulator